MDLAQYHELEAFAQFASDLDKATRDQLLRGEKLTEVLKQPQYSPLSVAKQISILFAANNDKLNSGAKMNDEDIEVLKKNISSFKSGFCGE